MNLKPEEEIGMEVHPDTTQYIQILEGTALIIIDNLNIAAGPGSIQTVPPNSWHNVVNISDSEKLKILTIYSPPEHPPGTIQHTKPREH
jgi:mannose-6-phosphate isomerase-like protein (cupin superfamily)